MVFYVDKPITQMPFTTQEAVQKRLEWLRDIEGLSWPKIAKMPEFRKMPAGTLWRVWKTGAIPKKWWRTLNVKAVVHTPRISVHKYIPEKAIATIINNFPNEAIEEIYTGLGDYLRTVELDYQNQLERSSE